jgi:hypothetical protein
MRVVGIQTKKNVKGIEYGMEYFIINLIHLCHPTLRDNASQYKPTNTVYCITFVINALFYFAIVLEV